MKAMEAFYTEHIGELKAQNEELKQVINCQKEDVRDAIRLRERNQVMEIQFANLFLNNRPYVSPYSKLSEGQNQPPSIISQIHS